MVATDAAHLMAACPFRRLASVWHCQGYLGGRKPGAEVASCFLWNHWEQPHTYLFHILLCGDFLKDNSTFPSSICLFFLFKPRSLVS